MASLSRATDLWRRGQVQEAEREVLAVVAATPDDAAALRSLAELYAASGRHQQALDTWGRVCEMLPSDAPALRQRAQLLMGSQRLPEAVECLRQAVALDPANARGHQNLGLAMLRLGDPGGAIPHLEQALTLDPNSALACLNLGVALQQAQHFERAQRCLERALVLDPHLTHARLHLSELLKRQSASAAAAEENRAHESLAINLMTARRYAEAAAVWDQLLARDPHFPFARGLRFHCRLQDCDWRGYDAEFQALAAANAGDAAADTPFNAFVYSDRAADQLQVARRFSALRHPLHPGAGPSPAPGPRLRVAYLSADFHAHATAYLIAELLERHDRGRFEIRAVSYGEDDGSEMRRRLYNAVEHFSDVRGLKDEAVAADLRSWGADIAVDLKGHTGGARTGIFAHRPAPVQINFLGFPGSMGAPYYDYLVADRRLIPHSHERFYDEKCILMPGSYQPNDARRPRPPGAPPRSELGLSARGFVFGCFNHLYKITPALFGGWMHLLRSVPGSVLWLLASSAAGARNLRNAAAAAGVEPQRIVFAPHWPPAAHLARYRHMDLFLDTYPCNAHTTASDALWMGVPVVTRAGDSFASRVATSLLHATGLGRLSTECLEDYIALAEHLAHAPGELDALRQSLAARDATPSLFDAGRYTALLERAYAQAVGAARTGQSPSNIELDP